MVRITALMDDRAGENLALVAEHGLSFYIEYEDKRFLFDCGASDMPLYNAHRLGVDLSGLDAVMLSHSHYDHSAGYRDLIEEGLGSPVLYTGQHFFEKKYGKDGIRYTDLSAGFDEAFLREYGIEHHEVKGSLDVCPGVRLITDFPRKYAFETIPERFVRQTADGYVRDDFPDEICLTLETPRGVIVLVGCSHPGILNIITHVKEVVDKPIAAVFGGTHLMEASEERINQTMEILRSMGVGTIGFSHCSGEKAECMIHKDPEMNGAHLGTGDMVVFD